ncbi:FHA domain-containing protein [Alishewanella sp. WH16-1]|uniref:FHA domain-containing protein n=1 Tax=Alishewanella sp. WH16-1 TaxID=1651088 RepID=UPI00070C1395|nr:FHA domain-containing protein [Alishewanella sp. WH16-1]
MQAQLTVITPQRAADQFVLAGQTAYTIGRAADNDIVIAEPSVSRQHAQLRCTEHLWMLTDLNSVNGLRTNGLQQQSCLLEDGSVVLVGNVPVLFQTLAEQQLQQQRQLEQWRRQQLQMIKQQADTALVTEVNQLLSDALTLCQMERAAVLLGEDVLSLRLVCTAGVSNSHLAQPGFFGSLGAVQSALSGATIIANDISQHQALSQRTSVKLKRLSAIACFPLRLQQQVVGVFYIDSQQPSKFLSQLDVELLQALVNNVGLCVLSQQLEQSLQKITVNSRQAT